MKHIQKTTAFSLRTSHFRCTIGALMMAASATCFAGGPSSLAYSNTPESHTSIFIKGKAPVTVATLSLSVTKVSKVLVQFTSGLAAETSKGCPCSVRAFVTMDDQQPRPVKRVNVASPAVQQVDKYEHDRQNLDASTVFDAKPGPHTFTVTYQRMDGDSDEIEIYYPNVQAIAFSD